MVKSNHALDLSPENMLKMTEHLPPANLGLSSEKQVPKVKLITGRLAQELNVRQEVEGIRDQMTALLEKIDKPASLDSPPENGSEVINWTEAEAEAVYAGTRIVMLGVKFPPDDFYDSDKARKMFLLLAARAVTVHLLPVHRWLEFANIQCLPKHWTLRFLELYPSPRDRLPKPVLSAPPVSPLPEPATSSTAPEAPPPAPDEPEETSDMHHAFAATRSYPAGTSRAYWTEEEADLFCLQLAHRLRKRNLNYLPEKSDRGGCRLMLEEARVVLREMPEHKRKTMINLSALLHDEHGRRGLKKRMLELFKKPRLPELPAPARIDPVSAGVNGNGTHAEPVPAPEPTTPEPAMPAAGEPLAVFISLARSLFDAIGKVEHLQQRLGEAEGMNNLLMEELDKVRGRCDLLATGQEELRRELTDLKSARAAVLPRVAIVGCRGDEFDEIVKLAVARGLHARFKHYDQDQHVTDIHADYALMMKWLSHAWQDKIVKNGIPRGNYAFTDGGATKAVKQIEVWIGESSDESK